jgi:hypothetical protein
MEGGIPEKWLELPSPLLQKDTDARWVKKNEINQTTAIQTESVLILSMALSGDTPLLQ